MKKPMNMYLKRNNMAKMTRKQAVELLKNRKVHVKDEHESEAVQGKLFEVGFKWIINSTMILPTGPYLYFDENMTMEHGTKEKFFYRHSAIEISAEEILSIEIVEQPEEPEQQEDHDLWEQRRYEIAKEMLPVTSIRLDAYDARISKNEAVRDAVAYADALIEKLKEPKK